MNRTKPLPSQWSYFVCMGLALWLAFSPHSMGYQNAALRVSDLASAALLIALTGSALLFRTTWIKWLITGVGLWLTAAPLIFWAPDAASYANDTVVGSLVIVCSIIIPSLFESGAESGAAIPPDWSYNPSSWNQRTPIIALAFVGFLMARYLSAFQLGHIRSVWDPFFGKGTETILTSDISRWFPVSDAGLGAWSYLLDALSGALGGTRRWRTMPWVVVLFGIMVVPPGVTSITLVILQPVGVGAWCTVCLITAVVMLLMVPPAIDEVVATAQALLSAKRQGLSLWKAFWFGVPEAEETQEKKIRSKHYVPWNLALCTALGVWCMASPAVFNAQNLASDAGHLLGALIVTFSVIAMAQVARPVRFINTFFGLILGTSTWFLSGATTIYHLNSVTIGVLLIFFSIPLGQISDCYGNYNRIIKWNPLSKKRFR